MRFHMISACAAVLAVAACASNGSDGPQTPERAALTSSLPQWVANPTSVDGFSETIAATSCVQSSGNFQADKSAVTASAIAELARVANVRATTAIQDTLRRNEESRATGGAATTQSNVSRETVEATELFSATNIVGARSHNIDYVELNGGPHMCAMYYVDEERKAEIEQRVQDELRRLGAFFDEDVLNETLFKADEQERLRTLIDQ